MQRNATLHTMRSNSAYVKPWGKAGMLLLHRLGLVLFGPILGHLILVSDAMTQDSETAVSVPL